VEKVSLVPVAVKEAAFKLHHAEEVNPPLLLLANMRRLPVGSASAGVCDADVLDPRHNLQPATQRFTSGQLLAFLSRRQLHTGDAVVHCGILCHACTMQTRRALHYNGQRRSVEQQWVECRGLNAGFQASRSANLVAGTVAQLSV
jgi:hypothetical protein